MLCLTAEARTIFVFTWYAFVEINFQITVYLTGGTIAYAYRLLRYACRHSARYTKYTNILTNIHKIDIVLVTNRVDTKAQDKIQPPLLMDLCFVSI